MPEKRPPEYTEGLGELIRAHRNYIGLSSHSMAFKLGMKPKSFSDIEIGRSACPPGLIDSILGVIEEFDRDVEKVIDVAKDSQASEDDPFEMPVRDDPRADWQRAVIGRAAVDSGVILPILVGNHEARRSERSPR
ncbi:helix-turn-helix domain-containing protein [Mycobacteroides abscessus]|uniref:helix-turn-helix domain-containing protein n=1 Tax=Mycobacteroides abscessus TaxID=36809 RepID=UPI0002585B6E|nr:helix-turn-helix transcriptional regulator [Mycobacteroides abscessus]EIC63580.1 hypothetical protein OUW_20391 [Mycobacteroides abscessus M93]SLH42572.1 Uncharacterised protein [Mycobacteroides abscessus subsp. massiliense]